MPKKRYDSFTMGGSVMLPQPGNRKQATKYNPNQVFGQGFNQPNAVGYYGGYQEPSYRVQKKATKKELRQIELLRNQFMLEEAQPPI